MKILPFLFILIFSFTILGQDKPKLTNDSIMEMVKSEISDVIIVAKIKASDVDFDTSNEALKKLKEAKVSDNVQAAMIERASVREQQITEKAEKDKVIEITLASPENGEFSELKGKTKVYFYTSDTYARKLMTEELKRYPRLESVDTMEKADFILVYEITGISPIWTILGQFDQVRGDLYAVTLGQKDSQGKTRVRILYSVRRTRKGIGEANSAKATMQRFIIDFKKMHSEK